MTLLEMIRRQVPRELLVDLMDRISAQAMKSNEIIRDNAGLDSKRSREAIGQLRFRMQEQAFEETCIAHGGARLEGDIVPGTGLRAFQPYMRFGSGGSGVILGMATMPEPEELPVKNQSRLAGVHLNYDLTPRLDFDGNGPKIGDVFVLFVICRDMGHPGKVSTLAIGVVDSAYKHYIEYEKVESLLTRYHEPVTIASPSSQNPSSDSALVKLKERKVTFIPPEIDHDDGENASEREDK